MQMTDFMKALADDTRLRAFRVLAEAATGLCVAEMADILRKPAYAVSRSFVELRKSGLLVEDRQGKFVYYSLAGEDPVRTLGEWVLSHCRCDAASPNGAYDSERLSWRLSLRQPGKVPITRSSEAVPDPRPRVLFVCVHNSARSQFAEEYLRLLAGDRFAVESAGLTPGELNPHVVAVLQEDGIDLSAKKTRAVSDFYRSGATYQWVVTVCSREAEQDCPVFPGPVRRLSWPFPDPGRFKGTRDEIRSQVRELSKAIKARVQEFIAEQGKETA